LNAAEFEEFESRLRRLSQQTRLSIQILPVLLGDIAGVLMQEARESLFEDGEEVAFDPESVHSELIRMGHDPARLDAKQVRLLLDFFMDQMVDPHSARH
jgi:hypothetical protein